jgi:hypothetical protein
MTPPSVIVGIVRPVMFIVKLKEAPIRAFAVHVGTFLIAFLVLIDTFPVQPLIKRSAMVENAI